jgi:hypothetical protein
LFARVTGEMPVTAPAAFKLDVVRGLGLVATASIAVGCSFFQSGRERAGHVRARYSVYRKRVAKDVAHPLRINVPFGSRISTAPVEE